MADRYIRQSDFENSVYLLECPVALEKGAILLDANTNTYILQLKLGNICKTSVVSARVYIEALDGGGSHAYPGVFSDYSEFAAPGEAFGTKKLIPLPNNNAVAFRVYIEKVATENGATHTFEREQYTMAADCRDIAAERETVFNEVMAERAERERIRRIMWGAKWYHAVFVIGILSCLWICVGRVYSGVGFRGVGFLFNALLAALPCFLWIFPWRSIGTPQILKHTAMTVFFLPTLFFLSRIVAGILSLNMRPFHKWFFSSLGTTVWLLVVCVILFLCIFFNVRRFDKSQKFTRSLLFWLKPEQADKIEKKTLQYAAQVEKKSRQYASQANAKVNEKLRARVLGIEVDCPHCGGKMQKDAKFCGKCGGKANGE